MMIGGVMGGLLVAPVRSHGRSTTAPQPVRSGQARTRAWPVCFPARPASTGDTPYRCGVSSPRGPGGDGRPDPARYVVLASADDRGFASLRRSATMRSDRYAIGRALRQKV